jgi:trimeric autotransporter adhesin
MAQTNFTPILLYASSTPTNVPSAGNLTNSATGSEIAINIADKNLFFKDSGGVVNTVPIRQSSTSSNGWLSATDWNTFNNKAPATSGTSILYGNGSGGFSNVTIGSGVSFVGGTLSATGTGGTITSVTGTAPVVSSGGTTPAISLATAYGDTLNPYASKTANYVLAAPNGSAGVPTFRALVTADVTGLGTMATQNANAVAITGGTINGTTIGATTATTGAFTTVTASTSLTTPTVQATNSAGLALKNSAGTTQISMGAGGGDNVTVAVSTNLNGTNAQIDISPTGTGHVHIKPTGTGAVEIAPTNAGTMNNMVIGGTTPLAITGTTITATTFSGSGASLTSIPNSALVNSTISGVALGGSLFNLTAGTGVSFSAGTTYNGSTAITINATGTGGTVTSVAALTLGTTGTDLSSTVANSTTTPVITLNVPTASATNRGALSAADWSTFNNKQPAGSYLTAVSVVSANGFAGTSSGGTTPALTLSTSITGLLKGNGTAISAATSGTDYAPATSGTSILYGNGSGGFSNVTVGTGLTFIGGTLASTASGGTVTSVAASVPAFLSIAGSPITTSGTLAITLSGTALPVANGGTGLTSLTAKYIPYGNGTSAFSSSASLQFDGSSLLVGTSTSPSSAGISIGATGTVLQLLGGMQNTSWRIRERTAVDWCAWTTNINDANTQDDATKSSWVTQQGFGGGNDCWRVGRYPAGSSSLSEFGRFDASGNWLVNTTAQLGAGKICVAFNGSTQDGIGIKETAGTGGAYMVRFLNSAGSIIGTISNNANTGILYNVTSDYRLKDNALPLTGASNFIMALQPKTWDWRNGSGKGVGFIAHEFMEIAKHSGNGIKDAVDAEGKPVYQSVQPSSSEVIANLVALAQEQQALIVDLKTRLTALEAK